MAQTRPLPCPAGPTRPPAPCRTDHSYVGTVYYFNFATGESLWDHPMDEHYKELFAREKQQLEQGQAAAPAKQKKAKGTRKAKMVGAAAAAAAAQRSDSFSLSLSTSDILDHSTSFGAAKAKLKSLDGPAEGAGQ